MGTKRNENMRECYSWVTRLSDRSDLRRFKGVRVGVAKKFLANRYTNYEKIYNGSVAFA